MVDGAKGGNEPRDSQAPSPHGPGPAEKEGAPKRASVFPSRPPSLAPPPPSGGPRANYRIFLAIFWVAVQAVLVVTADRRSDGAFGFRMFSESSSIKLALYREVDGPDGRRVRVHVDDGVWSARARDGRNHRHTWYDRVPMPYWVFDREMHASYGAAAQLSRLQGALDDVVGHLSADDDLETRRLVLDVTVRRNGRDPVVHQLSSRERVAFEPAVSEAARDGGP
ncbi:MAG TPA: hypothetical protein VM925_33705 [Labilithrix sp.]|nr:hypothetical protein [Labilithrix sp.]